MILLIVSIYGAYCLALGAFLMHILRKAADEKKNSFWIHEAHKSELGKLFVRTTRPTKNIHDWKKVREC